jgi:hypothetical protein
MKILLEKYISYHKCPHCGGEETFHSHAMENLDMTKYGNVIRIALAKSHFNPDDVTLTKNDLCLSCGREWVMYIQRIDSEGHESKLAFNKTKDE